MVSRPVTLREALENLQHDGENLGRRGSAMSGTVMASPGAPPSRHAHGRCLSTAMSELGQTRK
jgi:hypothetical protein